MGGSSKQSTSTQQVQIPQQVLDRYNAANDAATAAASAPFQQYGGQFVAPINDVQRAGIYQTQAAAGQAQQYFLDATHGLDTANAQGTGIENNALGSVSSGLASAAPLNAAAGNYYTGAYSNAQPYNSVSGNLIAGGLSAAAPLNSAAESGISGAYAGAQPYNQAATGLAAASAGAVNPSNLDAASIGKYLSPYLGTVLGGTSALLNQNNQQAMSGQTGNAIRQGAFGGDRAGIAAANLSQQQNIANANIYSGILNEGYNNALSAAQQQQGVQLGAGQANRTALGAAGQELAGIGQQQYTQGTGTAQAQAQQGQLEFGQNLGAASQVQGLGNQVFNQGSQTGQNEQGLGAAQVQEGVAAGSAQGQIGQNIYNMGANTAQETAALGAGAQAANLQGAQAQLAAGQVQQGTQQAQDTALYNQFLQQQSYPFQTAQFLANVAEGTGSLSGSTTTTTQPGGFFSDERLKDDMREIGRTFDGQPIYSYKYKGDDRTTIGLSAQKVEKKHPDAVGLSAGYRTVDYGRATEDSAERGKFAFGGSPLLPGLGSADMQAILQAQEAMYAPYGAAGGVYGSPAGNAPRGGSSYVPQANLPVSHLTVASGLPAQKTGAENVKDVVATASKIGDAANSKYGKQAINWVKGLGQASNDNPTNDNASDLGDAPIYKNGGLARAKRYASGGMPYSDQVDGQALDIPDETPSAKLQTAGDLPSQKSGMSDVMDAVKIAAMIAKMKRGGRVGYADGGAPDSVDGGSGHWSNNFDPLFGTTRNVWTPSSSPTPSEGGGTPWYLKPVPSPEATGHAIMQGLRGASDAFFADQDKRRAQSKAFSDTDDNTPAPHVGTPVGPIKIAAPSGLQRAAHVAAPAPADTPLPVQTVPADTPLPVQDTPELSGLGAATMNPQNPDNLITQTPTSNPQSILDRLGHGASSVLDGLKSGPVGDYASGLKHGDKDAWLSLLAGLSAAGTAPTVHPGVALAAGLGAGAQTYLGSQKALADIAQTQANIGQTQAGTNQRNQAISIDLARKEMLGLLRKDASGPIVDPSTGIHYSNTQTPTSGTVAPQTAPEFKYLGPSAQAVLPQSAQQYLKDTPGFGLTPNPGNIATSQKIIEDTYRSAANSQNNLSLLNEQAGAILSSAKGGVLTQGAMAPIFQPYVEKWNSLVADAGHPELAISGLGDAQISHKLQVGQAIAQTTNAGQHAHEALSDVASATASNALDPHAAAVLMAQNAVNATRDIDRRNALEEAKRHAPQGNYEAQDIMAAFDHDMPPTIYNAMRDSVAGIYQSPIYKSIHEALSKPGTPAYEDAVNKLNLAGKAHGIPNFARVFTGG